MTRTDLPDVTILAGALALIVDHYRTTALGITAGQAFPPRDQFGEHAAALASELVDWAVQDPEVSSKVTVPADCS